MTELLSENAEASCKNLENQTDRINFLIKQVILRLKIDVYIIRLYLCILQVYRIDRSY